MITLNNRHSLLPLSFSPYLIEGMAIINKFFKKLKFRMINLFDKYNEESFS
jgi:hypothetical protein